MTPIDEQLKKALKKYLVFKLNNNFYAVSLSDVKEVIGLPAVVPVPQCPNYLLGLINLRGKVISAIDLRIKLNIPKNDEAKRPAMILIESTTSVIGCLVDSITEVMSIANENIEISEEDSIQISNEYIKGIAKFQDRPMILIIDLKKIVNLDNLLNVINTKIA